MNVVLNMIIALVVVAVLLSATMSGRTPEVMYVIQPQPVRRRGCGMGPFFLLLLIVLFVVNSL